MHVFRNLFQWLQINKLSLLTLFTLFNCRSSRFSGTARSKGKEKIVTDSLWKRLNHIVNWQGEPGPKGVPGLSIPGEPGGECSPGTFISALQKQKFNWLPNWPSRNRFSVLHLKWERTHSKKLLQQKYYENVLRKNSFFSGLNGLPGPKGDKGIRGQRGPPGDSLEGWVQWISAVYVWPDKGDERVWQRIVAATVCEARACRFGDKDFKKAMGSNSGERKLL